jgi:putative ABC transport system permease protein
MNTATPVPSPLRFQILAIPRIGHGEYLGVLDWRVLVFAIAISVATGVAFGLVPALNASRVDLDAALRAGGARTSPGRRHERSRSLLVISEVTLAVLLLIGSALLIRSFVALRRVNPGFDAHSILTMRMALTGQRFATTAAVAGLLRDGVERINALPGVEVAAATLTGLPLEGGAYLPTDVVGRPPDDTFRGSEWSVISPDYFEVFRIPLIRGRLFTERDGRSSPPVAIINQAMVRRLWPDGNPLNDQILTGRGGGPELEETTPRQIVGIVGDIRQLGLDREPAPTTYMPLAQLPDRTTGFFNRVGISLIWLARTRGDPHRFDTIVRRALMDASGGLPVARIRSMDDISSVSTARSEFDMWLMAIFGASALLLAAVGVYGVMSYSVRQREREIGIRLALGASPVSVRQSVIGQGMRLAISGVVIGVVLALGVTRLLETFLFGVSSRDWLSFTAVAILLSIVALFAVWFPAARATSIDPMTVLKAD